MRKGCGVAAAPEASQGERVTKAPAPITATPARSDRRLSFIAKPHASWSVASLLSRAPFEAFERITRTLGLNNQLKNPALVPSIKKIELDQTDHDHELMYDAS
jgi:hypothetical protein